MLLNKLYITPDRAQMFGLPVDYTKHSPYSSHAESFLSVRYIHCKHIPVLQQLAYLDAIRLSSQQKQALEELYCTWLTKCIGKTRSAAPELGIKLLNLVQLRLSQGAVYASDLAKAAERLPAYDKGLLFCNLAKACYTTSSYAESYSIVEKQCNATELTSALNNFYEIFF